MWLVSEQKEERVSADLDTSRLLGFVRFESRCECSCVSLVTIDDAVNNIVEWLCQRVWNMEESCSVCQSRETTEQESVNSTK